MESLQRMSKNPTWHQLLNAERRRQTRRDSTEARTEHERDFDRLLFSAPVRRLADKTQVFPLERNDSVRTRLTHSHEVANLARSMGTDLAFNAKVQIPAELRPERNIPAILAAIGLVHDLGNPPFGHQGEQAIQAWFLDNSERIFDRASGLTAAMKQDFLSFEGNAQTFRVVARLQVLSDDTGLNLTYATLASLLKYTVASDKADKKSKNAGARKPGYFASESDIVREVRERTGLRGDARHPLTYLMEACDDICYTVIDAEDAVKKGLASYPDLREHLSASLEEGQAKESVAQRQLVDQVMEAVDKLRSELLSKPEARKLSPGELNDLTMQYFRVHALSGLVPAVTSLFVSKIGDIVGGTFQGDLISEGDAAGLIERLRTFDRRVAYRNREVLALELQGSKVIRGLMDRIWAALQDREDLSRSDKPKFKTPLSSYTYERLSENYRRVFEASSNTMPVRYREAQLITDQLSGMTDSFALALYQQLRNAEKSYPETGPIK
jgi:dGTPase